VRAVKPDPGGAAEYLRPSISGSRPEQLRQPGDAQRDPAGFVLGYAVIGNAARAILAIDVGDQDAVGIEDFPATAVSTTRHARENDADEASADELDEGSASSGERGTRHHGGQGAQPEQRYRASTAGM
jgi:hypothetical protein